MSNQKSNQNEKEKGIFSLFKFAMSSCCEDGCCNMKIMPKADIADKSNKGCCCNMPNEQAKDSKSSN